MKPRPILDDMPPHILEKCLLEESNTLYERSRIGLVSKKFKKTVEKESLGKASVGIKIGWFDRDFGSKQTFELMFKIGLEKIQIVYDKKRNRCYRDIRVWVPGYPDKTIPRKAFPTRDVYKLFAIDLISFLKKPNVTVTDLRMSLQLEPTFATDEVANMSAMNTFYRRIKRGLEGRRSQLQLTYLLLDFIGNQDHVMSILPFCNPEKLVGLTITNKFHPNTPIDIGRIMECEQVQSLRTLALNVKHTPTQQSLLNTFNINLSVYFGFNNMTEVRQLFLKSINNLNFETCRIQVTVPMIIIRTSLHEGIRWNVNGYGTLQGPHFEVGIIARPIRTRTFIFFSKPAVDRMLAERPPGPNHVLPRNPVLNTRWLWSKLLIEYRRIFSLQ